ncbi:probable protein phosphatase 2C 51, partial [Morus notabilis]|uniref:probable protein phosphatase 2C 51 n=1 Tax=Morus notabilis TaxID=981085 RepID=UPI000CED1444
MNIRKKSKLHSPPARDHRRLSLNSSDSSKISLVKTKRARRIQRMKLQTLDCTCRTEIHFTVAGGGDDISGDGDQKESKKKLEVNGADPLKITVNLSFASTAENNNDGVVLQSFGSETREENVLEGLEGERKYGVVSVIGRRSEMEDAVRAELGFAAKGSKRYDFFGVYDGHGGTYVASACRERLHEVVASEIEHNNSDKELEWEKVMEGCFGKMDEEVKGNAAARTVGATAVVAVVEEGEVVVANCGDCRAVMSRAGLPLALSTDHKVTKLT